MPKISMTENQMKKQRILIIGAVAGGASFAARARRLSETAEIIMFDRGPYVSFANCGLPYYVGNVIPEEKNLLMVKDTDFINKFNIDVRLYSEILSVDRKNRQLSIRNLQTGKEYAERYDSLVIATGSQPVRPKLPGIDLPGVFTLRSIPDSNRIKQWIKENGVKEAVVVGGGLIGLEMTENLVGLGITVSIVEMLPHVVPFIDPEMAMPIHETLRKKGVKLYMNMAVKAFSKDSENPGIHVLTEPERELSCDMVILAIGSRPEANLARDAGLEIGELGGIRVNEQMQTSDDNIWAVGDVVESKDIVTGEWMLSLLASPANQQARIAADSVFGRKRSFRGVQATAVCRIFGTDIASTGVSEKTLKRLAGRGKVIPYEKVYLHPRNHAEYYPGSGVFFMKLIFSSKDGRVLGAQAVGAEGVDKRIDGIAMSIQLGATVYDLEEAELSYAPQFGSAREAANMAGMAAANILRGDIPTTHWDKVNPSAVTLLDPREPEEYAEGHVEGAINIPLSILRRSLDSFDRQKEIFVYCNQGKTSYYACRVLLLNGFRCTNISGGFKTYKAWKQLEEINGRQPGKVNL